MHRQLTGDQSFSNLICDKLIQLYVHVCEGYIQMHSNTEKVCQENTLLLKKQIRMYDVVSRGLFFATSSHFLVTYFWNSNRHFWFLYSHFFGAIALCMFSVHVLNKSQKLCHFYMVNGFQIKFINFKWWAIEMSE